MLAELTEPVIDACTLNNALNAMQLAILIALLKWVRGGDLQQRSPPREGD